MKEENHLVTEKPSKHTINGASSIDVDIKTLNYKILFHLPKTVCLLSRCRHDLKVIKLEGNKYNKRLMAPSSVLLQLRLVSVWSTVGHANYPPA